jgi:hypothetical protein
MPLNVHDKALLEVCNAVNNMQEEQKQYLPAVMENILLIKHVDDSYSQVPQADN